MTKHYELNKYENGKHQRLIKLERVGLNGEKQTYVSQWNSFLKKRSVVILIERGNLEYFRAQIPPKFAVMAKREFIKNGGMQFSMKVCKPA